jgi:uncharacterized membrane protein HdeD (DUF308 family)
MSDASMSDAWAGVPERLAEHWWAFALRGILGILFGIFAFIMPGITLAVLLGFFAAYMAIDGVLAITAAVRAMRQHGSYWPLLLEGIADIATAVIAILWPGITLIALVFLAGAWAVVSGVLLVYGALRMDRGVDGRIWLILSGILSTVWGVLLFLWPIAGLLVLTWWIGAYALVFGVFLLIAAFRLRQMLPQHGGTHAHA